MPYPRRINPYIWDNPLFKPLTDDSKLLYCYVLTHNQLNSLGVIKIEKSTLAEGLNWTLKRFQIALKACIKQNFILYDDQYSLLWFVNFFDHHWSRTIGDVMDWQDDEAVLPECSLKEQVIARTLKEAQQIVELYYPNPEFEKDHQLPVFVKGWLQELEHFSQQCSGSGHGTLS